MSQYSKGFYLIILQHKLFMYDVGNKMRRTLLGGILLDKM